MKASALGFMALVALSIWVVFDSSTSPSPRYTADECERYARDAYIIAQSRYRDSGNAEYMRDLILFQYLTMHSMSRDEDRLCQLPRPEGRSL